MTGKEFMNAVANGETDILQQMLEILTETRSEYCVIGGLAVNAYAEPVVSLDLDVIVAADKLDDVGDAAKAKGLNVEKFEHCLILSSPKSDLRIQLQIGLLHFDVSRSIDSQDMLASTTYRIASNAISTRHSGSSLFFRKLCQRRLCCRMAGRPRLISR